MTYFVISFSYAIVWLHARHGSLAQRFVNPNTFQVSKHLNNHELYGTQRGSPNGTQEH
jgi:hypothetical protein